VNADKKVTVIMKTNALTCFVMPILYFVQIIFSVRTKKMDHNSPFVLPPVESTLMEALKEMEELRRMSEQVWLYTSSKSTKAALDALYGIILGLRRIFEYPVEERLARAFVVLSRTPFVDIMRAFRCPVITGNNSDRDAARSSTMRLREQFRTVFRRFINSLKEVYRADDIPRETLAKLRVEGPEQIARYLDNVQQQIDNTDINEGLEDRTVQVAGSENPLVT